MTEDTSSGSLPVPQQTGDTEQPLSEFDDPCKAFKDLSAQKRLLVSGQATAEYEYHGNGTQKRLKYSIGNIAALDTAIRNAQAECAKSLGLANPGRRFALTAGEHPRRIPGYRWSPRLGYY